MRRIIKAFARWVRDIAHAVTQSQYATFRAYCYKCATAYHAKIRQVPGLAEKIDREPCRCYSPDWFDSAGINKKSGTHDLTGHVPPSGWNAGGVAEDYNRTQEFAALVCRMEAGKNQVNIADMSEILANINRLMPNFYRLIAAEPNESYWKRAKDSGKIVHATVDAKPKDDAETKPKKK